MVRIELAREVEYRSLMGDHTIDTESSALMALRIIVNAYAAAGIVTGDPLPFNEVTEGARHQSVTGAQKNVGFMARGLAASLIHEDITRFAELPSTVVHPAIACNVVTDPSTNISVRAYATVEFERPLLVLDACGA